MEGFIRGDNMRLLRFARNDKARRSDARNDMKMDTRNDMKMDARNDIKNMSLRGA